MWALKVRCLLCSRTTTNCLVLHCRGCFVFRCHGRMARWHSWCSLAQLVQSLQSSVCIVHVCSVRPNDSQYNQGEHRLVHSSTQKCKGVGIVLAHHTTAAQIVPWGSRMIQQHRHTKDGKLRKPDSLCRRRVGKPGAAPCPTGCRR